MTSERESEKRELAGDRNGNVTVRNDTRLAGQVGHWSSIAMVVLLILYIVALMTLIIGFQKAPFTTIEAYADDFNQSQETVYTIVQLIAFLACLLVPVWFAAIHQLNSVERQVLSITGLAFAVAFMITTTISYYVQFVVVRQNIMARNLKGLEWFLEWNLTSVMFAIIILGWFVFLGLAHLFIAPVFRIGRLECWTRVFLLITGVAELGGGLVLALGLITWIFPFVIIQTVGGLAVFSLTTFYFRQKSA